MKNTALVVVDMLYDFIDGSLACKNSESAVNECLKFIDKATSASSGSEEEILDTYPILFIRDFHPADHSSFSNHGGLWPSHCVEGTRGCEIHEGLVPYAKEELTFYKGRNRDQEQYSGFEGNNDAEQSLGEILDLLDIEEVYLCGIATEYCVKNTCLDLLKAGFKVNILEKALAYVDPNDHKIAISDMQTSGAQIIK